MEGLIPGSGGGGAGALRFFFFLITCESASAAEWNGNDDGSPGKAIGERSRVICKEFERRSCMSKYSKSSSVILRRTVIMVNFMNYFGSFNLRQYSSRF